MADEELERMLFTERQKATLIEGYRTVDIEFEIGKETTQFSSMVSLIRPW